MKKVNIRNYKPTDIEKVIELQEKYSKIFPDAPIRGEKVYSYSGFENGKNILCAFDDQENLFAYAPMLPQIIEEGDSPNTLWIDIKADPNIGNHDEVKDLLFEKVLQRGGKILEDHPERRLRLGINYNATETLAIDYFRGKGAKHYESLFEMSRDLSKDIPHRELPEGIEIKEWKPETDSEKERYIAADNIAFPHSPMTKEKLDHLLKETMGEKGRFITAFKGDEIVASVAVYWSEAYNEKTGRKEAMTEEIFVMPQWRGKGLAKAVISHGLNFLKDQGLEVAHLRVECENDDALLLYRAMGYEVFLEEVLMELWVE